MSAANQGSVITGGNPAAYNTSDPILLFIIQAIIIIVVTRGLNIALSRFRQPRVISEVIGGIVLGPSVMGRIPHFQDTIFPKQSLPYLNLVANLGLVLYLFLVGVELDLRMVTRNARVSLSISAAGIIIPFGLGAAVSYGLYDLNNLSKVTFPNFLLFMGVAMSITAFPVLARIVTELKLLRTKVGSTALCAAVGDDIVAWTLLALVVSILNSTNSLTALYVFLLAVAWALILIFVARPILLRLIVATNSNNTGPSLTMMAITLLLVLFSAFVTDSIGVHAMFGGFMVGVIIPHDGGFALRITERMEDLVTILLLPIYFALSGLKTQIGLLNTGEVWGYVFLVIAIALFGKISGASVAARLNKFTWRESLTIGVFMSCKGLVELIVLNVGLDAGVISERIFVIMVVEALVTTILTTPLVTYLYPSKYQSLDIERCPKADSRSSNDTFHEKPRFNRFLVVLNQIGYLSSMMTLVQLLRLPRSVAKHENKNLTSEPVTVNALRLVELTERAAGIIKLNETEETILHDPIMNVFRIFGQLNFINVKAHLSVVKLQDFAEQVAYSAKDSDADLVIVPWEGAGSVIEDLSNSHDNIVGSRESKDTSSQVANFVIGIFSEVRTNVAIFVDRGLGMVPGAPTIGPSSPAVSIRVFLPFFGGADDREALLFVVRLLENKNVKANVVRIQKSTEPTNNDSFLGIDREVSTVTSSSFDRNNNMDDDDKVLEEKLPKHPPRIHQISSLTVPVITSKERDISDEADKTLLSQLFGPVTGTLISNPNINYLEIATSTPLQTAIERTRENVSRKDLVVIGRGKVNAVISHREEWMEVIKGIGMMDYGSNNFMRKSLGDVAEGLLVGGVPASVLVIQAKGSH